MLRTRLLLTLTATCSVAIFLGFDPPIPCPTTEILAGAGTRAVKLSAGCVIPVDGYWRSVPSQGTLEATILAGQTKFEECERSRNTCTDGLVSCRSALFAVEQVPVQECPPLPDYDWFTPAAIGCAACSATVGGVWVGSELGR